MSSIAHPPVVVTPVDDLHSRRIKDFCDLLRLAALHVYAYREDAPCEAVHLWEQVMAGWEVLATLMFGGTPTSLDRYHQRVAQMVCDLAQHAE